MLNEEKESAHETNNDDPVCDLDAQSDEQLIRSKCGLIKLTGPNRATRAGRAKANQGAVCCSSCRRPLAFAADRRVKGLGSSRRNTYEFKLKTVILALVVHLLH